MVLFFGIFLLVVIVVWKILAALADGDSKGSGGSAVPVPSANNGTSPGKIAAGIAIAGILLVVVMWVWGFFGAASDMEHGMNMLKYGMRVQNMNPITRDGYDTYMECFTDFGKRREQMRKFFE